MPRLAVKVWHGPCAVIRQFEDGTYQLQYRSSVIASGCDRARTGCDEEQARRFAQKWLVAGFPAQGGAQNAPSGSLAGSEGDERLAKGDVWVRAYRAGYRAAQDALGVRIEGESLTVRVLRRNTTEAIDYSVIVGLRYMLDVERQRVSALKGELQQIAGALGTGETGEGLVSVARAAHTAEQQLAAFAHSWLRGR